MKAIALLCVFVAILSSGHGQNFNARLGSVNVRLSSSESPPGDVSKLRLLHVFTRHGDRTPVTTYPNDPYPATDASIWKEGNGQITNNGKQRSYKVGKYLRLMYEPFLDDVNKPNIANKIRVRATDYDRTIMSGQCLLAGLLPPKGSQVWEPSLPWQPIAIHTVPKKQDWLAQESLCPAAKEAVDAVLTSKQFDDENRRNRQLYEYLELHSGMPVKTTDDVADIYGTLTAEYHYGLKLPQWTESVYPERMTAIAATGLKMITSTRELKQLFAGPSLKDVADHMRTAQENISGIDTKLYLYMTHDKIIGSMLSAMDMVDQLEQTPPYSATLIFELHEYMEGSLYVKVLYYDDINRPPKPVKIPGCDDMCSLDKFLEILEPVLPPGDESEEPGSLWKQQCKFASNIQF